MKKKITLYMFVVSLLAIISAVVITSTVFQRVTENEFYESLKTSCIMLEEIWDADTGKKYDLDRMRITVVDNENNLIYDSYSDVKDVSRDPEIIAAREKGEGRAERKSDAGTDIYYYAQRFDNGRIYRVSMEASSFLSMIGNMLPAMFCMLFMMILICFFVTKYLTIDILRPIEKVADSLDYSEEPEYHELVPIVNRLKEQHERVLNSARVRQEFSANVSHELKTPLAVISGYSEIIENNMVSKDEIVRIAGEIHHSSNRLLALIDDVIRLSELDYSEPETIYEKIDLFEIIKELEPVVASSAEQHEIALHIDCEHCFISGEKRMIEEIVSNLINNAIIYNRPGGNVWVRVYNENNDKILVVKDDGIGIPQKDHERIFERFYRVDKSRSKKVGGTGLGLAIVKHAVSSLNGKIVLKSEEGKGTEIKIIF